MFDSVNTTGDTGTLGNTTLTLNSIVMLPGQSGTCTSAVVYTSTASEKIKKNTGITCSDGNALESIDITTKSKLVT